MCCAKQDKIMTIRKWSAKLVAGSAIAALLYTTMAIAVGFGEITLKSSLNEPLEAEIALNNIEGIEDEMLLVQLASAQAFTQAGIGREYYLTQLDFAVGKNASNDTVIKVTSDQPVVEPYLDFLVQLEWPSGRLLREYTLLLDLPVYNEQETTVEVAPAVSAPAAVSPATSTLSGAEHLVVVGDTLWNVSKRLRPRGLTILQTMDALYSQNPDAFVRGDANRMKKGAILRLPSKSEISLEEGDIVATQIGLAEPEQAVEQNKDSAPAPEQVQAAEEELFPEPDYPASEDANTGRLELVTAYDADSDEVDGGETALLASAEAVDQDPGLEADASAMVDEVEQLSSKLTVAQDEVSKTQLENDELRERMMLLEAQVDTMATLVEVSEDQSAAEAQAVASPEQDAEQVNESVAATEQSDEASVAPVAKATPKSKPADDLMAQLESQPWYVWAGLVLVILTLVVLLRRATKSVDKASETLEENLQSAGYQEYDQDAPVDTGANLLVDDLDGLELNPEDQLFDETDKEIFAEEDTAVSPEIFDSMVEAAAEAEVYLSLGNLDQAIEILEQARAADPEDTASRLKLMEILFREERRDELKPLFLEIEKTGDEVAIAMASVILGPEDEFSNIVEEPSASLEEEPSVSLDEEPSASLEEEPLASLDEEPSASPNEEPSASLNKEPSAPLNEEPSAPHNKEPSAPHNKEQAPDTLADLETADDQVIDELAESVLDEDFLDDSFMDGGIFSDVSPAEEPVEVGAPDDEQSGDSFEKIEPVVAQEPGQAADAQPDVDDVGFELPGVDALKQTMGAEAAALEDISANLDSFEGLDDVDEINSVDVKMDLASTYIEMGDAEGAREILAEIIDEADAAGKAKAQALLDSMGN
jgi:pilus assembly protein FimV